MKTGGARLTVKPLQALPATAADSSPVRGAAVIEPSVQPGVDTALRPTASGMDVYENLIGGRDYTMSWRLSLAGATMLQADDKIVMLANDGSVLATVTAAVVDAGMGTGVTPSIDGDVLTLRANVPAQTPQATVHFSITAERDLLAVSDIDPDTGRRTNTVVDPPLARYLLSSDSTEPDASDAATSRHHARRTSRSRISARDSSGDVSSTGSRGCREVDKAHTERTLLRAVAFRFHGVISYCWNRSTKNVTHVDVSPGYRLSDIDSQEYWKGIIYRDNHSYNWHSGGSGSGYKHVIQGHFENCVIRYGCIGTYYPKVSMYAHYDGTLHYSEEG